MPTYATGGGDDESCPAAEGSDTASFPDTVVAATAGDGDASMDACEAFVEADGEEMVAWE